MPVLIVVTREPEKLTVGALMLVNDGIRPKLVGSVPCARAEMKHSDFFIGCEFTTAAGSWRCTDVGTRTIAAIRLDLDRDPAWYNGPPYPVVEHLFDEDGMEDCDPLKGPRPYDNSGMKRIVVVKR